MSLYVRGCSVQCPAEGFIPHGLPGTSRVVLTRVSIPEAVLTLSQNKGDRLCVKHRRLVVGGPGSHFAQKW